MDKQKRNLLVFGYGLAVILTVIALRLWFKHGFALAQGILYAIAFTFVCLTIFRIDILEKIYTVWMKVGHKIGGVVSNLILILLFYCIFAPVGIVLRILRKDLLDQRLDYRIKTYWVKKKEEPFDQKRYQQQF